MTKTPTPADARPDPAGLQARIAAARSSIARETGRARRALWVERAAQALWPLWALAAAFLGLALLGLPQALPFWGHVGLLAAFAAGAVWLGHRAALAWRTPSRAEAEARLDAGSAGRPVAAVQDALAAGAADPQARALWEAHQARMAERAAALRAAPADLRVSAQDRFALRHAAALALAVGALAQIGDSGARLAEALSPVAAAGRAAETRAPGLEAWASPPPYTGAAPLYLTEKAFSAGPITLPVGSEIALRVFDAPDAPVASGGAADPGEGFADQGGGTFAASLRLARDGALDVAVGETRLAAWAFVATPDAAPTIAFVEPPTGARSGALQFAFETADDYGVVSARAEVTIDVDAAPPEKLPPLDTVGEPAVFELPLPLTGDAEQAAESVVENLVAHPWAGLPVVLTLIATDGAGQEGRVSARLEMPARPFHDPLARALIEQRRHLAWSLAAAPRVQSVLTAVTAHPEDAFEDAGAYLTTRTAIRRLAAAAEVDALRAEAPGVIDLLWEAALRIEDGDLSEAERRLRELQEQLAEALEEGAPQDEIDRLMEQLREAIREYMEQLAQEAMRDMEQGRELPQVDPDQQMSRQDLEDFLDQLEQALRDGMEDVAREMLRQLQQMLENMQMAQSGQPQQGQGEGDQAMQQLQDMIGRQQGLADRSFEALREGQGRQQGQQGQQGEGQQQGQQGEGQQGQGQRGEGQQGQGQQGEGQQGQGGGRQGQGSGEGGLGAIARDQEALRRMLDDLRQGLPGGSEQGQGPGEALGRAEENMGAARDALERGDADGALQDQVEALDALREGAQALAEQLQQGQPGQNQQAGRAGRSGDVRDEDPLGRPTATDGPLDGDSVRVPDESAMKRARELMDEIRRRAGDRTRSAEELDYLRRLLERF